MSREEGQTLGEYVLILSLVIIVAVVAVTLVGRQAVLLIMRIVNAF